MPAGVDDRDADIWEALIAVGDAAGDQWGGKARLAAAALVAAAKESTPSLNIRLLTDLRTVFGDNDAMSTKSILEALHDIDDAPWAELFGKGLNARGLGQRLAEFDVHRADIRVGTWHGKGYRAADLWDAWERYVASVTDVTDSPYEPMSEGADAPEEAFSSPSFSSVTSVTPETPSTNGKHPPADDERADSLADLLAKAGIGEGHERDLGEAA
jgi:hypothetical protein